ncbi:sigma-70 family RNA polymerase sigma factor [Oceaniserpentilla sp. 4NH20-0058]|uniref:sigma-70 family RNA polymerase sigma factor n=1 Tax=Oceaniserpentilla sp. 4NH20-0058 TaxID=3127660 RepID=UPI00310758C4
MSLKNANNLRPLDQLILRIASDQDQQAFIQLFEEVGSKLKAYAMRCGALDGEAEDIVQECMLTVWRKAHQFNPKTASANTWLYTIVRNKRIDMARKTKADMVVSDDLWPEPEGEELELGIERDLNGRIARTLLYGLPDEQRQIVYKVYFEGKSHSEIANELDLPLGTIKSRLRLAMKKLDTLAQEQMTWLIIILLMNY